MEVSDCCEVCGGRGGWNSGCLGKVMVLVLGRLSKKGGRSLKE